MQILEELEFLLKEKKYRDLDNLFNKTLPKTTNLDIFKIYIKYIKEINSSFLLSAYEYSIQRLWFHYDLYEIIKEYNLIQTDLNKRMFVYKIGLNNPIKDLNLLYQDFLNEKLDLPQKNEFTTAYNESLTLLIKLEPFLQNESENFSKIIGLEKEERKLKIIKYFFEKYPRNEEIYFIFGEECKDFLKVERYLKKGIKITDSTSLKLYYSLYFKSTKFLDLRNEKMALIYFNLKKTE
ncbi:hypothetical protein TUBRATIS_25980 [Tubulinosema ratisbonensis]|uniref:Uncharacterized protein n=1 Tax=Tubulinosema ratisbonensis TaxID=291195 RepID=A0A437AIT7_9MICR|nr:hypothetical protein TUBRATIS_25980 [Tubulinosema ratisbonensis]